jgi:parvulin-like peptidyl-prolyl isomerase
MVVRVTKGRPRWGWRRLAIGAGCAAGLAAAAWGCSLLLPRATAQPAAGKPAAATPAPAPEPAPVPSDYSQRPVAYLGGAPVTREQLGEYLIPRSGPDRLDAFLNRLLIERACKDKKIEVSAAEVEAALAESITGLGVDQKTFVNQILKDYHKTLYEWKEDVIRPKLLMAKLCKGRVFVSDEEMRAAFEAAFGEKVECRVIYWKDKGKAEAEYPALRDSEEEFDRRARTQQDDPKLAANGGKIPPVSRTGGERPDPLELAAFKLQPGEVSALIDTPAGGALVLKCDRRLPPDTSVSLENPAVRQRVHDRVLEQKVRQEIAAAFDDLKEKVKIEKAPDDPNRPAAGAGRLPIAFLNGEPVTREQYGEYLIARLGAEKLPLMLNRTIILQAAKEKGVTVADDEVEADLTASLPGFHCDSAKVFEEQVLKPQHTTLYGWKEDAIRPRLLMEKMCRERVAVAEPDLEAAFEAYYGEKVACRVIYWPKGEEHQAVYGDYPRIRQSDAEFERKAKMQANPKLAAAAGRLDQPVGRHTTGDEQLEREIFKLQPGEISPLINRPEGLVVVKCDERIPADADARLDDPAVHDRLYQQVFAKKLQAEIPVVFKELQTKAQVKRLLTDPNHPDEGWVEEARQALGSLAAPAPPATRPDAR